MLNGYGAPLQIYQHLEYHEDSGPGKIVPIYTPFMMISVVPAQYALV